MSPLPSAKHATEMQTLQPVIPDRLYFKIGDVAKICGEEPYVLRFWETQFSQLRPNKSGTGQRLYRRRDVEMVLRIKQLVHGEGYTIPGARQALAAGHRRMAQAEAQRPGSEGPVKREATAEVIRRARNELREIAKLLGEPAVRAQRLP